MTRISFNKDWIIRPPAGAFADLGGVGGAAGSPQAVTLPHDAMLGLERAAEHDSAFGYFPGGVFEYTKTFDVPEEWRSKRVTFQFEAVYRDAMVFINREFAAHRPYGYSNFYVPADAFLRHGESNTIRVVARAHQDSRWYPGIRIHRGTWIIVKELVHIALDRVKITTPDVGVERAVVAIATTVQNEGINTQTVSVATEIRDATGGFVVSDTTPVTLVPGESAVVRQRLYVDAFCHGLSYTTFDYKDLKVSGGETITATFTVTNTGKVAGADVPQVYLTDAAGDRRMRLLGFERVELAPGASRIVTITTDPRLLARFDGTAGQWRIAAGTHRVVLGKSAGDLVLTAEAPLTARVFGK